MNAIKLSNDQKKNNQIEINHEKHLSDRTIFKRTLPKLTYKLKRT